MILLILSNGIHDHSATTLLKSIGINLLHYQIEPIKKLPNNFKNVNTYVSGFLIITHNSTKLHIELIAKAQLCEYPIVRRALKPNLLESQPSNLLERKSEAATTA